MDLNFFFGDELLLWYITMIIISTMSLSCGWFFVSSLRDISRRSTKLWKLCYAVLATPTFVCFLLHLAWRYGLCDRFVADITSLGIVVGVMSNIFTVPTGKESVQLIAHQITGKKNSVWLDSREVLVGDARNALAESMHIVPASRVNIESGKGFFLEDLNAQLFQILEGSSMTVNFFGFTTVSCYISIKDEEVIPNPIEEEKMNQRDRSNTHFRSLISNIKGEARYGHHLTLTAKVATANADVRGLFVSPVEKFAAAAPVHQLAVPSILSSAMYVRLLSWNAVNAAAPQSELGGSEYGDTPTNHSTVSTYSPPVPTPALSRSRAIIDTASRLYKGALEPSTESIRNGDLVVIECDGK